MAKNYAYSIMMGTSVDQTQLDSELKKIQRYVNKQAKANPVNIETKIDVSSLTKSLKSSGVEKSLMNVRDLLDKITGEKIGEVGTFKIGDKILEVQKSLKGTVTGITEVQQAMQRLGSGLEPITSFEKKVSTINEKINQLKLSPSKFVNQNDIKSLEEASNRIVEISSQLDALREQAEQEKVITKELEDQLNVKRTLIESQSASAAETKTAKKEYVSLRTELLKHNKALTEIYNSTNALKDEQTGLFNSIDVGFKKVENASLNYKTKLTELSNTLKNQLTDAQKLQKSLNQAYAGNNQIAIQRYTEELAKQNAIIASTKRQLTTLTGTTTVQKDISSQYGAGYSSEKEAEQYAIREGKVKQLDIALKELYNTEKRFNELSVDTVNLHTNEIEALKSKQSAISSNIDAITSNDKVLKEYVQTVSKAYQADLNIATERAKDTNLINEQKNALNQFKNNLNTLTSLKEKEYKLDLKVKNNKSEQTKENKALLEEYRRQISVLEELISLNIKANNGTTTGKQMTESYTAALDRLKLSRMEANAEGKKEVNIFSNIAQGMKEAIARVVNYTLAFQSLNAAMRFLSDSVNIVKELNKSITDVQMVTGSTADEIARMADQYSKMGAELGSTTEQIASAASEWLRQGRTVDETNELIRQGTVLARVGAVEDKEAVELLTSSLNGYKFAVEDASHIVDAFSAIDLKAATSVEELATAMARTANIGREMGVDFDTLAGYIGTVSEVTRRSSETIGEAFKTLFARFANVKAGKFVDDETGEALNDIEKVLNKLGITTRINNDTWRETDEILAELAGRWKTMSSIERSASATAIAGTRQIEIFNALMSNFDRAQELAKTATDSTGSSLEKFDFYLESIEAKLNTFKSTWEDLVYNEQTVKWFGEVVDIGTGLLKILQKLTDNGVLPLIIKITAMTALFKTLPHILKMFTIDDFLTKSVNMVNVLQEIPPVLEGTANSIEDVKAATEAATTSLHSLYIILGAIAAVVVVKTIDHLLNKTRDLTKANKELATSYQSSINEINSINSTLEDNKKLLEELSAIPTPTLAEQAEITKLERENELLNEQLGLKQKIAQQDAAKGIKGISKAVSSLTGKPSSDYGESVYQTGGETASIIETIGLRTTDNVEAITQISDAVKRLYNEGKITKDEYDDLFDRLEAKSTKVSGLLVENATAAKTFADAGGELGKEYSSMYDDIMKQIRTLNMTFDPAQTKLDYFNQIFNSNSFKNAKEKLQEIKNSGTLLVTDVLPYVYQSFKGYMDETGVEATTLAKTIIDSLDKLPSAADDAGAGIYDGITKSFEDIATTMQTVDTINKDFNETGVLTLDTLKQIVSTYGDMSDSVNQYILGLKSEKDIINELNEMYKVDEENFKKLIVEKLQYSNDFYNSLGFGQQDVVNQFKELYGVDLSNAKNLAQAKQEVETQLIMNLSDMWKEYYGIEVQYLTVTTELIEQRYHRLVEAGKGGTEAALRMKDTLDDMKNATKAIDDISLSGATAQFNSLKSSIDSTSDAASDAQKAMNNLVDITVKMLKSNANKRKQALKDRLADIKDEYEDEKDALKDWYDERKDVLEDSYDSEKKLIEDNRDAALDSIDDQIDAYEKLINAKIKALEKESDERTYQQEIDEMVKEITDLESNIITLSQDTSASGVKKRLEMEEELAEKRKELEDKQYEHSIEGQKDALESELDRYKEQLEAQRNTLDKEYENKLESLEKEHNSELEYLEKSYNAKLNSLEKDYEATEASYNRKIAALDTYLSKEGALQQEARNKIANSSQELYNQLIAWNREYGDGADATINSLFQSAGVAITGIEGYQTGLTSTVQDTTKSVNSLAVAYMMAASAARDFVSAASKTPSKKNYGPKEYDPDDYGIFHKGGYVKRSPSSGWTKKLFDGVQDGLKSDEILAKLQDGEFVLTKEQQNTMAQTLYRSSNGVSSTPIESNTELKFDNLMNIVVQGTLDKSTIPELKSVAQKVYGSMNSLMLQRGNRRNAKASTI